MADYVLHVEMFRLSSILVENMWELRRGDCCPTFLVLQCVLGIDLLFQHEFVSSPHFLAAVFFLGEYGCRRLVMNCGGRLNGDIIDGE